MKGRINVEINMETSFFYLSFDQDQHYDADISRPLAFCNITNIQTCLNLSQILPLKI